MAVSMVQICTHDSYCNILLGTLGMTRSLSDVKYKQNKDLPPEEQAVIAVPDTQNHLITSEDGFLVLASDGGIFPIISLTAI